MIRSIIVLSVSTLIIAWTITSEVRGFYEPFEGRHPKLQSPIEFAPIKNNESTD